MCVYMLAFYMCSLIALSLGYYVYSALPCIHVCVHVYTYVFGFLSIHRSLPQWCDSGKGARVAQEATHHWY